MTQRILLIFLAFLMLPSSAWALASDWQRDDEASVRLISGVDATGQNASISLGLEVQMAPEWHTYWRSPGMAGLPPQIEWKDSVNLRAANLEYPAPKRYATYGLETIGYRDHVIFPITAELEHSGQPLDIHASLNILVCSTSCVPKSYELKLSVPTGASTESIEAKLIKEFHDLLPGDATASGIIIENITNNGDSLSVAIQSRALLTSPDLFIEDEQNISFAAPDVTVTSNQHSAIFKIKPSDVLPAGGQLAGMKLTLTVVNEGVALEQKITVPPLTVAPPEKPVQVPLALAVLFAVIGGFILNLMPCVLPVLSLKIFSAVGHGGGETKFVRRSFLMTAAGILFSFLVLAAVTISLKGFGVALGWGVQFQQPLFLICLVIVLTVFAANLWGLFEICLPTWLADRFSNTAYHPKLAGDFATGAFATLLATPCSAPFLGTAVGFALASGAAEILTIFSALGFGMIVPYLVVAFFPRLATALPKPGAWMNKVRFALGVALALTAVWLIWVMAAQITVLYAALTGLCMAGLVTMLALRKTGLPKTLITLGIVLFVAAAFGMTFVGLMTPKPQSEVEKLWVPYNANRLAANIQEGKTVFVDVTADWCLTCKANQKFVLSREDIKRRLFHSDIVAIQADWTNPDPVITAFLHKYGRYGIPFNIVYGPGAPQGIPLPELLTHDVVMKALDQAEKH